MSITAERSPFAHYEHHRRFETSENQKGSFRKRGALAVRNFFKSLKEGAKEAFGVQPNRVTPAQQFRERAAQIRSKQENVNIPTQRNGNHDRVQPEHINPRPAQEKAFDQKKGWLYDNVNYGLKQDAIYRRPHEDVRWLDDEPHIAGTVEASETIHYDNTPNSPFRATTGEAGRISYGRHDSGETRHSGHGRHSREDQDVIGSPTWQHQAETPQERPTRIKGVIYHDTWQLGEEAPNRHESNAVVDQSDSLGRHSRDHSDANVIGTPQWLHEQQASAKRFGQPAEHNPHNTEGVIGSDTWHRRQPQGSEASHSYPGSTEQDAWDNESWKYIGGLNPNTKQPYEDDSHHYDRAA